MNRRDFLLKSGAAVSLSLLARGSLSAQSTAAAPVPTTTSVQMPAPVTEFKTIRRNVGSFTGRGGTIGWLLNKDALVAVDTQFPDTAALFYKDFPGRDGRSFDAVIDTHHHGDHTGGNATLRPHTKTIVAHANVPDLMRAANARAQKPTSEADLAPALPDTTFDGEWKQDFGDETIRLRYFGRAHTKGDIVTHFEKANVVHLGDLLFNRLYPVIDRPGGASVQAWPTAIEKIAATYPADAIYMWGHSNPKFSLTGTKADLMVFRDYLNGLLAYVSAEMKAGKSKEEIVKLDNLAGFPDFHVPPGRGNRLGSNLSVVYDELAGA